MFLTPLQSLAMVALIVILAGAVMVLVHWYMPPSTKTIRRIRDQVDQTHPLYQMTLERVSQTENRLRALEEGSVEKRIYGRRDAQSATRPDDPMALWDAIVNDAHQHNQEQA